MVLRILNIKKYQNRICGYLMEDPAYDELTIELNDGYTMRCDQSHLHDASFVAFYKNDDSDRRFLCTRIVNAEGERYTSLCYEFRSKVAQMIGARRRLYAEDFPMRDQLETLCSAKVMRPKSLQHSAFKGATLRSPGYRNLRADDSDLCVIDLKIVKAENRYTQYVFDIEVRWCYPESGTTQTFRLFTRCIYPPHLLTGPPQTSDMALHALNDGYFLNHSLACCFEASFLIIYRGPLRFVVTLVQDAATGGQALHALRQAFYNQRDCAGFRLRPLPKDPMLYSICRFELTAASDRYHLQTVSV